MTDIESTAGDGLDLEQGSVLLGRLVEANARADAAQAEAAGIAARLAASGLVERIEGLPLEQVLILQSRQRSTDARFLITAGEVLVDMPVTGGLLAAGKLSWSVVVDIVRQVRSFGAAVRDQIDQRIAATVVDHGDIRTMDPDRLGWAVEQAVLDARRHTSVERTEQRVRRENYVAVQADLDGGIRGHFRFDAVTGAIILNALDDAADHISRRTSDEDLDAAIDDTDTPHDGPADRDGAGETAGAAADKGDDHDAAAGHESGGEDHGSGGGGEGHGRDGADGGWRPDTARGRQYGTALERLAHCWLTGGRDTTARPAFIVHVQAGDVRVNAAGIVELNVRGALPTITLAALEALTTDATLRTVIFDGARPLAVGKKRHAKNLPADVRWAVLARDRGCRFPGSPDPAGWCDAHHCEHQEDGGDHHPDGLAALSRRFHTLSHTHGWTLTVNPDSGAVTASRRDRSYTSLPPGTTLSPPLDRPASRTRRRTSGSASDRPPDRRPRGQPDTRPRDATRTGDPPPRGDPTAPGPDDTLPF